MTTIKIIHNAHIIVSKSLSSILILTLIAFLLLSLSGCKDTSKENDFVVTSPTDSSEQVGNLDNIFRINNVAGGCILGESVLCKAVIKGDVGLCNGAEDPTLCKNDYVIHRFLMSREFDCVGVSGWFKGICELMRVDSFSSSDCNSLKFEDKAPCEILAGAEVTVCETLPKGDSREACFNLFWKREAIEKDDSNVCGNINSLDDKKWCEAFVSYDSSKCQESIFDSCLDLSILEGLTSSDCDAIMNEELKQACITKYS